MSVHKFGAWLSSALSDRGLSQADLRRSLEARGVEVTEAAISKWINGPSLPGGRKIGHIAAVLGVECELLESLARS